MDIVVKIIDHKTQIFLFNLVFYLTKRSHYMNILKKDMNLKISNFLLYMTFLFLFVFMLQDRE